MDATRLIDHKFKSVANRMHNEGCVFFTCLALSKPRLAWTFILASATRAQ